MSPRDNTGITERHQRGCSSRAGGACTCKPAFQVQVYDARERKRISRTFATVTAARRWRTDAPSALRTGDLSAERGPRLTEAIAGWVDGMRTGAVTNRSGDRFKPAAIRGYEQALRLRVLPRLGERHIREIEPRDVQQLVDELLAAGLAPATVASALTPLRAFYRRATARGDVRANPTLRIEKPGVRPAIKVTATPAQAAALLQALPADDQPLWALAFYAGLRRGELIALRWEDVDLAAGVIHVRRGWDDKEGEIKPKSRKGIRKVPVPSVLRDHLLEHRVAVPAPTDDERRLFRTMRWVQGANDRAKACWTAANEAARREDLKADQLPILVLHGARHTFASLMIAAGVNAKALSTYMGHSNIGVTLDLYGHLLPGNESEAAGLFDAYLARSADGSPTEADVLHAPATDGQTT